jgi:hypothetical protein
MTIGLKERPRTKIKGRKQAMAHVWLQAAHCFIELMTDPVMIVAMPSIRTE